MNNEELKQRFPKEVLLRWVLSNKPGVSELQPVPERALIDGDVVAEYKLVRLLRVRTQIIKEPIE